MSIDGPYTAPHRGFCAECGDRIAAGERYWTRSDYPGAWFCSKECARRAGR